MSVADILARTALAKIKQKLSELQRPAIELASTPMDDADISVGASKLGGAPDLPRGTAWPISKLPLPRKHGPVQIEYPKQIDLPADGTIALPFVAQIALPDVAKRDTAKQLPKQGLLSFFYDHTAWWTRNGKKKTYLAMMHAARVRVLYTPTTAGLARQHIPASVPEAHPSARYSKPIAVQTLPNFESCWFSGGHPHRDPKRQLKLTGVERAVYIDALYDARANRQTHMLLGHADYVQPYGLETSYVVSHSYLWPDEARLPKSGAKPVRDEQDSQLLLQISARPFGRGGRLLFFIRNADLAAADFSRVWVWEQ